MVDIDKIEAEARAALIIPNEREGHMIDDQQLRAAWVDAERIASEAFDHYLRLRDAEQVAWRAWRATLVDLRKQGHEE